MLDISIVKKSGVPSFELGAAVYEEQTPYLLYAAPPPRTVKFIRVK